jgi:hypothetical protein
MSGAVSFTCVSGGASAKWNAHADAYSEPEVLGTTDWCRTRLDHDIPPSAALKQRSQCPTKNGTSDRSCKRGRQLRGGIARIECRSAQALRSRQRTADHSAAECSGSCPNDDWGLPLTAPDFNSRNRRGMEGDKTVPNEHDEGVVPYRHVRTEGSDDRCLQPRERTSNNRQVRAPPNALRWQPRTRQCRQDMIFQQTNGLLGHPSLVRGSSGHNRNQRAASASARVRQQHAQVSVVIIEYVGS